jgi:hypothetical protein
MRTSFVSFSLISTVLIACGGDPPPPNEVRTRIGEDLRYVLTEGKAAMDGSTAALPSGAALGFATRTLEQARLARPLSRLLVSAKDRNLSLDGDEEAGFDPDAIIDTLNNKLFTDANHLGNGIYQVPASLVCAESVYDDTTGTTQEVIDQECATNLAKAELRVRVAQDDGLRFWIQLDANHDEPLGILLRHDELAVTVDLDDATDAMIALAQVFGEQAPNADLSGEVTSSIKIHGHAHASAAVSFDRALSIKFADQGVGLDSDGAFRFASAAGDIFAIELDGGNAPKADFDLGLGLTTAHLPADEVEPSSDLVLGGATVNATFAGNTLTMNNISLGNQTTKFLVGGVPTMTIDLNANDGRKLNATIVADALAGTETLTVSPRLDLQTFVDDEPSPYNVTRVLLDGSLRGTDGTDVTEVVSGTFSITTNPSQYGFSATAGQCVTATDVYDEDTYSSWTQYSVGACL